MFKMAAPIQSPTKWEVHSVIRFLNAKGQKSSENSQTNCRVQKIVHTLGAQNVKGQPQNEKDGFHAEVSHALLTGRR